MDVPRPVVVSEYAHPDVFEDGRIELGCGAEYASFFEREDHLRQIREAASELFGGDWSVEIDAWSGEEAEATETLADQRAVEREQRRQQLAEEVRENSVLQKAQSLFDLDDDDVRVDVELDE